MARGKENIQRAFLDILRHEPYASITAKEIATAAGISRTTFYRHYETREDVLFDLIDGLLAEVEALRQRLTSLTPTDDFGRRMLVHQMLQRVADHSEELQVIMADNGAAFHLISRSQRYLLDVTTCGAEATPHDEARWEACVRHYHVAGILAVVTDWAAHGCDGPVTEVMDFILTASSASELRFAQEAAARA